MDETIMCDHIVKCSGSLNLDHYSNPMTLAAKRAESVPIKHNTLTPTTEYKMNHAQSKCVHIYIYGSQISGIFLLHY